VPATFTEQDVPIHKHITLFWIPSISGTRVMSTPPLYPPSGDPRFHRGPKIQSLTAQTKLKHTNSNMKH